jgi:hypothetical protein
LLLRSEAKHGAFPRRKKNNAARRKAKLLASMAKVRGDFSRPLSSLASKEAELDERSAALANFPAKAHPDQDLLVTQLTGSVSRTSVSGAHQFKNLKQDVVRSYSSLDSRDAIESIVDRVIVGVG